MRRITVPSSVVEKVVGYKKIKFHTHENVGYGDVTLPQRCSVEGVGDAVVEQRPIR